MKYVNDKSLHHHVVDKGITHHTLASDDHIYYDIGSSRLQDSLFLSLYNNAVCS